MDILYKSIPRRYGYYVFTDRDKGYFHDCHDYIQLCKFGIERQNIYYDIKHNREKFEKCLSKMHQNDILVVCGISALRPNRGTIAAEWLRLRKIGFHIIVLNGNISSLNKDADHMMKYLFNYYFRVEEAAKNQNIPLHENDPNQIEKKNGRPCLDVPSNFMEIAARTFLNSNDENYLSGSRATRLLKMGKTSFYKYRKMMSNS